VTKREINKGSKREREKERVKNKFVTTDKVNAG
jgi:hypothetical protein